MKTLMVKTLIASSIFCGMIGISSKALAASDGYIYCPQTIQCNTVYAKYCDVPSPWVDPWSSSYQIQIGTYKLQEVRTPTPRNGRVTHHARTETLCVYVGPNAPKRFQYRVSIYWPNKNAREVSRYTDPPNQWSAQICAYNGGILHNSLVDTYRCPMTLMSRTNVSVHSMHVIDPS